MRRPRRARVRLLRILLILILAAMFAAFFLWSWPRSGGEHSAGSAAPGSGQTAGSTAPDPIAGQASGSAAAPLFRPDEPSAPTVLADPGSIPAFAGADEVILNGGRPNFTDYDLAHITGEHYSELDRLGRCGPAWALLERSMMPSEERSPIRAVRPSGWQYVQYPELVEDGWLYNRCHLIAYALTGQNDNERNLITGTRHMNAESMLARELQVMEYLEQGGGPVLYRVTPYFAGTEELARGVEMEAWSVADQGRSICFHVFVYNVQPGVEINYLTGDSRPAERQ